MQDQHPSIKPHQAVWDLLASVRLTVVLLLSLAAASIIGTLIPQNENPEWYLRRFGEVGYKLVHIFQIVDMYHSWWFLSLILILALNIVVCSIDRLSATWKIVFPKTLHFNAERFRKSKAKVEWEAALPPDRLEQTYDGIMAKHFGYHRMEKTDAGFRIFAESGRRTRLGVYVVHLSVVLLLIGSLIGSIFGFDGYVNIAEGEATNRIRLREGNQEKTLEFKIACRDFDISFYDNGMPKEYRSTLDIIENGKIVLQKNIIVNDPLRYKGINIFQSSYGVLGAKALTLHFVDRTSNKSFDRKARIGETVSLPDDLGHFVVNKAQKDFHYKGRNIGQAFIGVWTPPQGAQVEFIMPYPFPMQDLTKPESWEHVAAFQHPLAGAPGPEDEITLSFTGGESGLVYTRKAVMGKPIPLMEGLGTFTLDRFEKDYEYKGHPVGDAFVGTLRSPDGKTETVVLPVRFANFDRMRQGKVVISVLQSETSAEAAPPPRMAAMVTKFEQQYYTGLQVTRDPGVWVVYAGFILMIAGCYITFFMAHRRACVEVVKARDGGSRVMVAGTANRVSPAVRNKIKQLAKTLAKIG